MEFRVKVSSRVWEAWARKNQVLVQFAADDADDDQSAAAAALEVLLATALSTDFVQYKRRVMENSSTALMLAAGHIKVVQEGDAPPATLGLDLDPE